MDLRSATYLSASTPALQTLVLAAAFGVGLFFFPIAMLLVACLICAVLADKHVVWPFMFAAGSLFTLLNASKELAGDLVNYVSLLEYVRFVGFADLFDKETIVSLTGSYRVTEMGFYAPMWMLSKIFENQRMVIAVGASLGIYLPTFLAIRRIAARGQWSLDLTFVVLLFAFFAAINFVQTTHLLRQYIATSVIFLAFAFFLDQRRLAAAALAVAGCSIHNAAAILVADVMVLAVLFPYGQQRRGFASRLWRLLCAALLLGASLAAVSFLELQQFSLDESPISVWHFLVVGVFFGTALFMSQRREGLLRYVHYSKMTFAVVYTLSFGFFVIGIRLFALRYLAYLEWLFGLLVGGILHAMPTERLGRYFFARYCVLFASIGIFILRVQGAPWTYGGDNAGVFTQDFFTLLQAFGD